MRKYILIIVAAFVSCNSHKDYSFQEFSFMPQIYPYVDTIYANHNNNIPFYTLGQTDVYKLILYVYGDCSSCVAKISGFQDYVDRNGFLLKDVLCSVILYTENIEVLGYNLEKISNTLPLYIDTLKIFSSYNSAPFDESHIMLLNDSNNIIYSSIEDNEIGVNHLRKVKNMLTMHKLFNIN